MTVTFTRGEYYLRLLVDFATDSTQGTNTFSKTRSASRRIKEYHRALSGCSKEKEVVALLERFDHCRGKRNHFVHSMWNVHSFQDGKKLAGLIFDSLAKKMTVTLVNLNVPQQILTELSTVVNDITLAVTDFIVNPDFDYGEFSKKYGTKPT
jgi:hypothetical protein